MVVDIPDVVTYTNFGYHRLRGFWVAGGQISTSPVDFHRRPYNTLALPCERVIHRRTADQLVGLTSLRLSHQMRRAWRAACCYQFKCQICLTYPGASNTLLGYPPVCTCSYVSARAEAYSVRLAVDF